MSYVRNSLGSDETVIYEANFPWPYHLVSWLWLLGLGVFVIGIIVFVRREVRAWSTEMAVTDQRVIHKRGFWNIHTEELPLRTIEEVNLAQHFWGRVLNYGQLTISGTGDGCIEFPPAADPLGFRSAIEDARGRVIPLM